MTLLVSPDGRENSLAINQDAYYSQVILENNKSLRYNKKNADHGVYFFLISGEVVIQGERLKERDGLGAKEQDNINIEGLVEANLLIIEVPLGE